MYILNGVARNIALCLLIIMAKGGFKIDLIYFSFAFARIQGSVRALISFPLEFSIYFERKPLWQRENINQEWNTEKPSVVWLNTVGEPNHIANPLAMAKQNTNFFIRTENWKSKTNQMRMRLIASTSSHIFSLRFIDKKEESNCGWWLATELRWWRITKNQIKLNASFRNQM